MIRFRFQLVFCCIYFLVLIIFPIEGATPQILGEIDRSKTVCDLLNNSMNQVCALDSNSKECEDENSISSSSTSSSPRIIVIGDVHAASDGLQEILFNANITKFLKGDCRWRDQPSKNGVLLIQVGDMVDRGPTAVEAWRCLNLLQTTAESVNSRVIRLMGNHDLWWLKGYFVHRNKATDGKTQVKEIITSMRKLVTAQEIVGAYHHKIGNVDLVFSHGGIRPEMMSYIQKSIQPHGLDISAPNMVDFINNVTLEYANCSTVFCPFDHELFGAGSDRGGQSIGGPFWTSFDVLEEAAMKSRLPFPLIQIVGHTVAWCYTKHSTATPVVEDLECSQGLIRSTPNLEGICVDAGIYLGARAYLEITPQGEFISHQVSLASKNDRSIKPGEWTLKKLECTKPATSTTATTK